MNRKVEKLCKQAIDSNPNMLVPWYLMLSFLYYIKDESVVSDHVYDDICKRPLASWDVVSHWHKHLIDPSVLSAGSGFNLKAEDYPLRTREAAKSLLRL